MDNKDIHVLEHILEHCSDIIHLKADADIIVRKQQYYLQYRGHHYYICKVTPDATLYIEEMAAWKLQDIQKKHELEELICTYPKY